MIVKAFCKVPSHDEISSPISDLRPRSFSISLLRVTTLSALSLETLAWPPVNGLPACLEEEHDFPAKRLTLRPCSATSWDESSLGNADSDCGSGAFAGDMATTSADLGLADLGLDIGSTAFVGESERGDNAG